MEQQVQEISKKLRLLTVLVGLTLFLSLLTFASNLSISGKVSSGGFVVKDGGSAPSAGAGVPTGEVVKVSEDDDAVRGNKNAPVTIIEFSDFECPFCARFYSDTLPLLEQNYINTGKVKLIYRDFPLSFHPNAQKAAEAAECADDQGKFWEMHDLIFENQASLSTSAYKQWAAQLGLNTAAFNSCLDSGKQRSEVQNDFNDGQAAGVSGTPTFFVNGVKLVGAQPYEAFKQVIDAQLAA